MDNYDRKFCQLRPKFDVSLNVCTVIKMVKKLVLTKSITAITNQLMKLLNVIIKNENYLIFNTTKKQIRRSQNRPENIRLHTHVSKTKENKLK